MKKLMFLAAFSFVSTLMMAQPVKAVNVPTPTKVITTEKQVPVVDPNILPKHVAEKGGENEVGNRTPKRGVGPAPAPKRDPAVLQKTKGIQH